MLRSKLTVLLVFPFLDRAEACTCEAVSIELSGGALDHNSGYAGAYEKTGVTQGGRPVYKQKTSTGGDDIYLYYMAATSDWNMGNDYTSDVVGLHSGSSTSQCPGDAGSWKYFDGSTFVSGDIQVTCCPPAGCLSCCSEISVSLSGAAATAQGALEGTYAKTSTYFEGRHTYREVQTVNGKPNFLLLHFWWPYWMVKDGLFPTETGGLSSSGSAHSTCPEDAGGTWKYFDGNAWVPSSGVQVTCCPPAGCPPSPPSSTSSSAASTSSSAASTSSSAGSASSTRSAGSTGSDGSANTAGGDGGDGGGGAAGAAVGGTIGFVILGIVIKCAIKAAARKADDKIMKRSKTSACTPTADVQMGGGDGHPTAAEEGAVPNAAPDEQALAAVAASKEEAEEAAAAQKAAARKAKAEEAATAKAAKEEAKRQAAANKAEKKAAKQGKGPAAQKPSELSVWLGDECELNTSDAKKYADAFAELGIDAPGDLQMVDGDAVAWPAQIKPVHLKKIQARLSRV